MDRLRSDVGGVRSSSRLDRLLFGVSPSSKDVELAACRDGVRITLRVRSSKDFMTRSIRSTVDDVHTDEFSERSCSTSRCGVGEDSRETADTCSLLSMSSIFRNCLTKL